MRQNMNPVRLADRNGKMTEDEENGQQAFYHRVFNTGSDRDPALVSDFTEYEHAPAKYPSGYSVHSRKHLHDTGNHRAAGPVSRVYSYF